MMQYGHGEMKWINSYWKLRRKTLHSAWSSIVTDVASKRKEKETKKEKRNLYNKGIYVGKPLIYRENKEHRNWKENGNRQYASGTRLSFQFVLRPNSITLCFPSHSKRTSHWLHWPLYFQCRGMKWLCNAFEWYINNILHLAGKYPRIFVRRH